MPNLGYISTFNINGNELTLKDAALTEIVNEIIEAIGANNDNISERINNLHERSFDALIKISSQNESEISNIQDGMYKLQYVTVTGEGNEATETLNNSAILIQKGTTQYLYKDGQLSSRTKENSTWDSWIIYDALLKSGGQMSGPITFGTGVVNNAALVLNTKPIIMDNGTYTDSTYRYALNFNNGGIEFGNYKMHTRLLSWNNHGDIIHMISSNNTSGGTISSYKMLDERNSNFTHYYNYTLNNEGATGTVLPNDAILNYEYEQIKLGSNSQNLFGIGDLHPQLSMPLNSTQLTLNIGGETSTVTIQNAISASSFTGSHYYTLDQTNSNKLVQIIGAKEGANNLILGTGLTAQKVAQEGKTIGANPNTYNIEISSLGVTSFNGATGAVNYTPPVTSVNGMTGAVTVSQVQADWNATSGNAVILNKPDISTITDSTYIGNGSNNVFIHDVRFGGADTDTCYIFSGTNGNKTLNIAASDLRLNGSPVLTSETQLSKGTATGTGNAVTDINVSNHQITLVKGATYATPTEVQNAVATGIASLVNSAPATLDTLNELATALGNDPNFATTISNQIGQKYTKPSTGIPASDLAEGVIPVTSVNGMTGAVTLNSLRIMGSTPAQHTLADNSDDYYSNQLENGEAGAWFISYSDGNLILAPSGNNDASGRIKLSSNWQSRLNYGGATWANVGDILLVYKQNALITAYKILSINEAGETRIGLMSPNDKIQVNKIGNIESNVNSLLGKIDKRLPYSTDSSNIGNVGNGAYTNVTSGRTNWLDTSSGGASIKLGNLQLAVDVSGRLYSRNQNSNNGTWNLTNQLKTIGGTDLDTVWEPSVVGYGVCSNAPSSNPLTVYTITSSDVDGSGYRSLLQIAIDRTTSLPYIRTTFYKPTDGSFSKTNWVSIPDISNVVTSVNGMTGVVSLASEDVKALPDYSKQYLTFTALEDTTFTFTYYLNNALQYSLDGGATWTTLAVNTASPTVTAGNKILWKQTGLTPTSLGIGTFSSTGNFDASGNIMSLYHGDNFIGQTDLTGKNYAFYKLFYDNNKLVDIKNLILPATTLPQHCYTYMFRNCTALTTAPTLPATTLAANCYNSMFENCTSLTTAPELPATTLVNNCYYYMFSGCTSLTTAPELPATALANYCYYRMFQNCTALTVAPTLPATTLADNCYYCMFQNCTALTVAPTLPATTLANSCYSSMFEGCTSLTTAPELPATTLANSCYSDMFSGCTNLKYIKCLGINISGDHSTDSWVYGVASSGTFITDNPSAWPRGAHGIPTNWNIYTKSEYEVVRHHEIINGITHTFYKNIIFSNIRIWVDDFSDVSIEEMYDNYINHNAGYKLYNLTQDTLTIDNITYYIWESRHDQGYDWDTDRAYLLTTTNDYDELLSQSLSEDLNNDFTSFGGFLNEDSEEGYIDDNNRIQYILDVVQDQDDLYIYVDNIRLNGFGEGQTIEDYINDPETLGHTTADGCNPYELTSDTIDIDGETYYIWKRTDELNNFNIHYLLTTTNNYETLVNTSVESSKYNLAYKPNNCIFGYMDEDNEIYDTSTKNVIVKVE